MVDQSHIGNQAAAGNGRAATPRRGRALAALTLAALLVGLAPARALEPEPIRADVAVDTSGGYARILFHFTDEVEADVRLANNVLVVAFKTRVAVNVDRLPLGAPGYVNAARRDPDGMAVRMALGRKVRLHSIMAGERLYVDLLPDDWTAAPPALPIEVVQELARRARDAERKQREQAALTKQKQMQLIRVRVAYQPTFTRYIFELPELTPVSTEREPDKLKVVFDGMQRFDLAAAKAPLPPTVESIESEPGLDKTTVSFGLIGKVDVRSFREDNSYVVDIMPLDGNLKTTEQLIPRAAPPARPGEIASPLAPPPAPPSAPMASGEPPQAAPAPMASGEPPQAAPRA
jgi:hypothetical protein